MILCYFAALPQFRVSFSQLRPSFRTAFQLSFFLSFQGTLLCIMFGPFCATLHHSRSFGYLPVNCAHHFRIAAPLPFQGILFSRIFGSFCATLHHSRTFGYLPFNRVRHFGLLPLCFFWAVYSPECSGHSVLLCTIPVLFVLIPTQAVISDRFPPVISGLSRSSAVSH